MISYQTHFTIIYNNYGYSQTYQPLSYRHLDLTPDFSGLEDKNRGVVHVPLTRNEVEVQLSIIIIALKTATFQASEMRISRDIKSGTWDWKTKIGIIPRNREGW